MPVRSRQYPTGTQELRPADQGASDQRQRVPGDDSGKHQGNPWFLWGCCVALGGRATSPVAPSLSFRGRAVKTEPDDI
eukprot:scaffold90_cov264-Pinguiococcus_pyrenoidosus.AAC.22